MIEVTELKSQSPAENSEELFARIVRHVGRTILIQNAPDRVPFSGTLRWLRINRDRIDCHCDRPLSNREPEYSRMTADSAVRVLLDGAWLELNRPDWVDESCAIERVARY